jgi:hypothetical protein
VILWVWIGSINVENDFETIILFQNTDSEGILTAEKTARCPPTGSGGDDVLKVPFLLLKRGGFSFECGNP